MSQAEQPQSDAATQPAGERGTRSTLTGVVVSTKMAKTITVQVERTFRHAKYGKYVRRRNRYHAHVEQPVNLGDEVEIISARPMSASKRWRFVRVVKSAADRGVEVSAIGSDKLGGQS